MIETIYAIIMSAASALCGGFSGWFFTRKKYNTEVDANVILNLAQSFTLYKETIDYCEKRIKALNETLEEYKVKNDKLELLLDDVGNRLFILMELVCINFTCTLRKRNFDLFGHEDNNKKSLEKK